MKLYVGTSGYSYKEWKGAFYPETLPAGQMLQFYGKHFQTVEINNTFYRMPKASVLEAWAGEVPSDFRFVIKCPRQITHVKRLKDVAASVSHLFEVVDVLKAQLGPILFQLPPYLKSDLSRLRDFLALLPLNRRAAFEFRHGSWFTDETYSLLRDHRAALCIAEADNDLEIPFVATTDWGYLRLRKLVYDEAALKLRLKWVQEQSWIDAFVFFKHEDAGRGTQLAQRLLELAA